ncbi:ribosomal-protein-alanine N-acetyltransferase, partial [candidate division GN15 bacterium]|nr:ribosomal-protein-alanine N-acetyltransferase [candidate division GN15 bacterium]
IGYACYVFISDEAHLANIAVVPAYRRKSVAKQLLDRILQLAQEAGCRLILLEVRASNNAARRFYEKAGFTELYQRPRYYRHPVEDAVVMLLPLTPATNDR